MNSGARSWELRVLQKYHSRFVADSVGLRAGELGDFAELGEMVDVPRSSDHKRDCRERRQTAPVSPSTACERREHDSCEEERKLHLDEQTATDREARQARHAGTTEVLARENQPHRDSDEGSLGRVEHKDVKLCDQQWRAEHEDHGEQASSRTEQEPSGLIAAEREQRDEHEVLGDDRGGDVHPSDEHGERAYEKRQRRILQDVVERPEQVAGPKHVVVFDRRFQVVAGVVDRNAAILCQPPARERDEGTRHADGAPGAGAPTGYEHARLQTGSGRRANGGNTG